MRRVVSNRLDLKHKTEPQKVLPNAVFTHEDIAFHILPYLVKTIRVKIFFFLSDFILY